jgi:YceI-like domain
MKNRKLKSKDFFDVEHNPLITFHSTKVEQTGPNTVAFDGDFTIRGVTKQERLTLTLTEQFGRRLEGACRNVVYPIRKQLWLKLQPMFGSACCVASATRSGGHAQRSSRVMCSIPSC